MFMKQERCFFFARGREKLIVSVGGGEAPIEFSRRVNIFQGGEQCFL